MVSTGTSHLLSFDFTPSGPLHQQQWRAIATSTFASPLLRIVLTVEILVNGVEYGRGDGLTKADAKEQASMNAYIRLVRPPN